MTRATATNNIFAELKVPRPIEFLAKAELAASIFKIIKQRRLTQTAAGEILGMPQSKVSALLSGRLDGFSTDRLLKSLTALGCDVKISISQPHAKKHGQVQVVSA